jgi:hypothetical protein
LGDVIRVQRWNRLLGFGIIAPWVIPELDEEWVAVLDGLAGLSAEQEERKAVERNPNFENYLSKRRATHPSYRKR